MIHLLGKLPREVTVACSGGVDSMAVVDFLKRNHKVHLAFFDHGTEASAKAQEFLIKYSMDNHLTLSIGTLKTVMPKGESLEAFWRDKRYSYLHGLNVARLMLKIDTIPVITCHHLDDVLETWIFSSAHGLARLIPYRNNQIIRPFLLNRKNDLIQWVEQHNVPFIEDESNTNLRFKRNYIRNKVVPVYVGINEGIYKVLRKQLVENYNTNELKASQDVSEYQKARDAK